MSHLVRIETQVRDAAAVAAACRRLQLAAPTVGTFAVHRKQVTGLAVRLTEWRYPLVCHVESGAYSYENAGGRWGDERALDQFLQAYAIEKTRLEASSSGYALTERILAGGAVKLTLQVGGVA